MNCLFSTKLKGFWCTKMLRQLQYRSSNGLVDVDITYFKSVSIAEVHCAFPSGQQVLVLLLEGLQTETLYNYTVSASNDTLQLKVNVEGFLPPEPEIGDLCFWWFLVYV